MLSVRNLRKVYKSRKADDVVALDNVSIDFPETGFVFLLGKSGSGKSTLLNAIGGLDKFDGGEIIIKGKSSADFSQADFDSYRNTFIGFIFQEYNILENFSVAKNLALALELQGKKAGKEEVMRLLTQVEMQDYAKRKPNELSGGQKQRVAIARALIKNPEIIMADEPTGALDSNTGKQVMETLKELSKTKLVIVVSHDREFAEIYGDRIIELKDGKILHDVTKKEIEAQETKSGIKIIDNDIVYIKKGQEVSAEEMKAIVNIINNKTKEEDAFISFNKQANEKLKEGAKINDSGNKEKFLDTEKEDIKVKEYNPNSLKLIKSRLKFSDSLKMGASALKNKVGKLIFTILLSFFAFTVFGIVDAFANWNRAASVYQVMEMTGQKNIAMKRYEKESMYINSYDPFSKSEIAELLEKFPDYVIKPVVARTAYGSVSTESVNVSEYTLTDSNNLLKEAETSGYIYLTQEELDKLHFTKKGSLPQNNDECCISKTLYETIVRASNNTVPAFDELNPITISTSFFYECGLGSSTKKVVGVIDDGSDFSEYLTLNEEELSKKEEEIEIKLNYSFARLIYVTKDVYSAMELESYSSSWDIAFTEDSDSRSSFGLEELSTFEKDYLDVAAEREESLNRYTPWWNDQDGRLYTQAEMEQRLSAGDISNIPTKITYSKQEYIEEYYEYLKDGVVDSNGNIVLKDNEIIVSGSFIDAVGEDVYQSKINEGCKVYLYKDWKTFYKDYVVVGVKKNYGDKSYIVSENEYNGTLLPLLKSYSFMVSRLNETSEDKAFIKYLETFNKDNIKFSIQTPSTPMMDLIEDILVTLTSVFVWVALAFAVFAALMLMNFISTSISYKKREIGVLRALGARGSDIFGIFFNESMIIALINFVLSAAATIIVCSVVNSIVLAKLPVDVVLLNVGIRQIALILGVSTLAAFVGSFLPTFKISRKRPIDAINNR